ncbi:hypothetical protein [Methanolobus sp. ZRKC5]|uniref:hypothetical protein n=1 Tax=unclassified Methanolobus TaxID=2629569 RepID=UPI00313D0EB8
MYIDFYYLLFLLSAGSFIAAFVFPEKDNKLLFSILSTVMWILTGLASYYVEKVSVQVVGDQIIEHTTAIYSTSFAMVCGAFMAVSLIYSVITGLSFLQEIKGIKENEGIKYE